MADIKNSLGITILKGKKEQPLEQKSFDVVRKTEESKPKYRPTKRANDGKKINKARGTIRQQNEAVDFNLMGDIDQAKANGIRRATLYFTVDRELHERLIAFADAENRSKNNAIYVILRRYLMPNTVNQATEELTEALGLLNNKFNYHEE